MSNPLSVVIIGQCLYALAFPAVGLVLARFILRRRAYRGRTTGMIASLRSIGGVATVRFLTDAGEEVTAQCKLAGDPDAVRIGGGVRVLYDPAEPRRMMIDRDLGRGVLTAIWLLSVGTLIEVLSLATLAIVLH